MYRARPAGPALRACSARQSSLRTRGRGPRRCQPTMRDAADAHGAVMPLERWCGTLGTVEAWSRATELASRVSGLRRHPSAPGWPPTRGVAPPAARYRVFARRPSTPSRPREPAAVCAHRSSHQGARWPASLCAWPCAFKARSSRSSSACGGVDDGIRRAGFFDKDFNGILTRVPIVHFGDRTAGGHESGFRRKTPKTLGPL